MAFNEVQVTNTNYYSWKLYMEDLLMNKGLYRITLGLDGETLVNEKCAKWINHNDKARGLGMSNFEDLRFHI